MYVRSMAMLSDDVRLNAVGETDVKAAENATRARHKIDWSDLYMMLDLIERDWLVLHLTRDL